MDFENCLLDPISPGKKLNWDTNIQRFPKSMTPLATTNSSLTIFKSSNPKTYSQHVKNYLLHLTTSL